MCEICSKSTIKTTEPHQWRCFVLFDVNFEQFSNNFSGVFNSNFEQVNTDWVDIIDVGLF